MSTRYYRIIKDHPLWEIGTILSNEGHSDHYKSITPVFVKDVDGITDAETYYEGRTLVEHQTEWFEQVYAIGSMKKMAFGNKKQAQAAAAALYEGDK